MIPLWEVAVMCIGFMLWTVFCVIMGAAITLSAQAKVAGKNRILGNQRHSHAIPPDGQHTMEN